MKKLFILLLIGAVAVVGWYVLAPLFFDTVVDESPPPAMVQNPPEAPVFAGMFVSADVFHKGSGTVLVTGGVMRFEDFSVTNGPSLHVYLSKDPKNVTKGFIDLGELKGNKGNQNYELPRGVDLREYSTVAVYCVPFGVLFASARLDDRP